MHVTMKGENQTLETMRNFKSGKRESLEPEVGLTAKGTDVFR